VAQEAADISLVSVFDEVDECDQLAAHPEDPQRMAEGMADSAIVPRLAIEACEAALQRQADEPRFAFQLGRSFLAAGREKEAHTQFERAAQSKYAAAIAALADLLLDSGEFATVLDAAPHNGSTKPPTITELTRMAQRAFREAILKHETAAKAGFGPSRERIEALSFDETLYTQPILGQIANADFDAAQAQSKQPETRAYLYSFTTNILSFCGPVFDAVTVAGLAVYRFNGGITEDQEDSTIVSLQPLLGEVDAQRFVQRHGCDGPIITLYGKQLDEFFKSPTKGR
jgi:tetratricopeptide (TPR) repeat protein